MLSFIIDNYWAFNYVLNTILDAEGIAVNKTDKKNLAFIDIIFLHDETDNKEMNN